MWVNVAGCEFMCMTERDGGSQGLLAVLSSFPPIIQLLMEISKNNPYCLCQDHQFSQKPKPLGNRHSHVYIVSFLLCIMQLLMEVSKNIPYCLCQITNFPENLNHQEMDAATCVQFPNSFPNLYPHFACGETNRIGRGAQVYWGANPHSHTTT